MKKGGWKKMKGGSEAVYGMGLIGALVYFLQNADSFVQVMIGIGKSIVWPAFVVYELLGFLKI